MWYRSSRGYEYVTEEDYNSALLITLRNDPGLISLEEWRENMIIVSMCSYAVCIMYRMQLLYEINLREIEVRARGAWIECWLKRCNMFTSFKYLVG